ncbi:Nardilysin [Armadillidium nasatum]|uniref:Nardilysin n=1 Tax=Armadillidium nasatum TaxID=96803 RepID=A0A5N5TLH7_9CRUS|nr:Nardilysin [Armadillidium nasatum]
MEEMVVEVFSEIPNNGLPRIQYKSLGFPFSMDNFHKFYKVIPVNDKHTLDINWVLPPLLKYYHCKPLQYISFFFGHEGHGSIISFLKKKVWAVDICAGNDESGFERNSICEFFNIRIHLTDEGFRNLRDVLRSVFQYLDMVKQGGPNKRIFQEIQQIEQIDFDYAEDKNPTENVVDLSEAMQLYPTKHILTGPNLLFQYDAYIIRQCVDQMNIRNCNIMLSSKKFENEDLQWEVEEFFQTKFCVEDIPEEWLQEYERACLNYAMHLPFPNDFIPDNFYVHKWTNRDSNPPRFPENIVRNSNGRLWFKQDFKFNLPRAYCYMYYYFDDIRKSAEMGAMLDLFLNLFNQHIMEALYPANMAQYYTKMRAADWGFTVKINGFNQKLFKCLETILSQIEDFEKCLDDKTFEEMKQQQLKTYHNYTLSPDVLRRDLRLLLLQEVHWPVIEKMKALQNIQKEHFLSTFMRKVINNRYVKMLVQGNITADEAKNLFDLAVRNPTPNLECKPKCPEMRIRRCKAGEHVIRIKSLNSTSPNSTLVNYYQGERGCLRSELINEFVIMAMDEPVFDTLRTKDQLGYHVYCTNRNTYGILGISITVNSQADKYSCTYVHERMEAFLKLFTENLKNISTEEMESLRETLKNFKLTVDITLKEEMDRNWGEIISEKYLFSRFDQQLPIIPTITLEEVCAYLHKIANKSGNSDFRKLSVQIVGSSESTKETLPTCESTLKICKFVLHLIEQICNVNLYL